MIMLQHFFKRSRKSNCKVAESAVYCNHEMIIEEPTMQECQNTEWKETWNDEYLKWICGFANAQGGRLYIGIDDSNHIIGLPNAKKLLEDIPNKIVNALGIVSEVNLQKKDNLEYLEIIVSPSTLPIAYRGVYYYRSGSTKQELRGVALQDFLFRKMGISWDDMERLLRAAK